MTVRIVLADDMDLALEGMHAILRQDDSFQVVGTYRLLSEMLLALSNLRPDVILVGDKLEPGLDVLALVERIRPAAPRARILILSSLSDGLIVQELFAMGMAGYLYKSDALSRYLAEAIRTVLRGRPFLSPSANAEYLLAMQSDRAGWRLDTEAREILRQLSQGCRPQEIALLRNVSVRRVYWVQEKLRNRFGAETNEQLMVRAAEEGFLA